MLAEAIKDERYEDCQPINNQIKRLKEWEVQRDACNLKKQAAVADEDYTTAAKYAKEGKRLSELIANALCDSSEHHRLSRAQAQSRRAS